MKIEVRKSNGDVSKIKIHSVVLSEGEIVLTEVYNGILLESDDGETFAISMRDSGFEFKYGGKWFEAKEGQIGNLNPDIPDHRDPEDVEDLHIGNPIFGLEIGDKVLRRRTGDKDQWVETTINQTYFDLIREFPEDYKLITDG